MKINGIELGNLDIYDFTVNDLNPSYHYVKLSDLLRLLGEEKSKTSQAREVLKMLYFDHNTSDEDMHDIVTNELAKEASNDQHDKQRR